jgi:hypothetical protein
MINGTNGFFDRLLFRAFHWWVLARRRGLWIPKSETGLRKALKGLGVSVFLMGGHYARPISLPP